MKISIDTRSLEVGDVFIPVKGENFDGHDFIKEAIEKGASKILDVDIGKYAKKYRKKLKARVMAVTGSYGKTTIKDMLFYVLSEKYKVIRTSQNQNNEIGVPLTMLRANSDTDIIICELAMRKKGDISYLTQIVRPQYVVLTGIGYTHMEFFEKPSQIAKAKGEIFRKPLVWEKNDRYVFINHQSAFYNKLRKIAQKKKYKVLPYKGKTGPDQNINLCYLVGRQFGLSDSQIQKGLEKYQPSEHRLVQIKKDGITIIDDSYNSNPDGVVFALEYLKQFKGRKLCVLGDMLELGKYSEKEHRKLADLILDAEVSIAFTYGHKIKEIKPKYLNLYHFSNKNELNKAVMNELKKGDIILIKGSRGLKLEETVEYIKDRYV